MIIRNIGRGLVAACVKIARGRYRTFVINNPYVIDGDTLAAGDIRIRIWGIDAPEIAQQQGPAAKLHLKSLVAGKAVHVKPRSIDQYNRTVAQIFVDSRDMGACMVEDGFAIASTQFTRTYTKPMKRARRAKAGLWRQGGIENPISFRRSTI
jgi:endonuclease YncB( thermonuclease family)